MSSAYSGRVGHSRVSRSESTHSARVHPGNEKENEKSDDRAYPGSLHRNQRTYAVPGQFHSMLDVEDPPSLKAANIPQNDSMESLVDGKLSQRTQSSTSLNDRANILFLTQLQMVLPQRHQRVLLRQSPTAKPFLLRKCHTA
jgi:hypothetical protein